ncbi:MAG TPA: hypothetical protein VMV87_00285 [Burkholderiales bacterium]|nr:hypothetical protein [Burkholderiales bacterium]
MNRRADGRCTLVAARWSDKRLMPELQPKMYSGSPLIPTVTHGVLPP